MLSTIGAVVMREGFARAGLPFPLPRASSVLFATSPPQSWHLLVPTIIGNGRLTIAEAMRAERSGQGLARRFSSAASPSAKPASWVGACTACPFSA